MNALNVMPGSTGISNPQLPLRGKAANSMMLSMSNEAYHADRTRIGSSLLKRMLVSPGHFKAALAAPESDKAHFAFGRATHAAILEPAEYERMYAVFPLYDVDRRSPEWKSFVAANPGKIVLTQSENDEHFAVRDAVFAAQFRGQTMKQWIEESRCESTIAFDDPATGIKCKVRPDALHPQFLFDLKTANDVSSRGFIHHAVSYDYDLQAFKYSFGAAVFSAVQRPFVFVVVEKAAPYSVLFYVAGESFMDNGAAKYQEAMSLLKGCRDTDYWPGLGGEHDLEISPYQVFAPNRAMWLGLDQSASPHAKAA